MESQYPIYLRDRHYGDGSQRRYWKEWLRKRTRADPLTGPAGVRRMREAQPLIREHMRLAGVRPCNRISLGEPGADGRLLTFSRGWRATVWSEEIVIPGRVVLALLSPVMEDQVDAVVAKEWRKSYWRSEMRRLERHGLTWKMQRLPPARRTAGDAGDLEEVGPAPGR